MSCRTLLISIDTLYEWVDIALDIDAEKLTRAIMVAQDRYIKPVLCQDLFEELQAQIDDDNIQADYQNLLNAIAPTLSFRVYARFLNSANIDSTEKGLRTYNEDNSEVISDKRLGELIKQADQDALSYEQDLKIFLQKNKECFSPYYDNCGCDLHNDGYGFKITSVGAKARKPKRQLYNLLDSEYVQRSSIEYPKDKTELF